MRLARAQERGLSLREWQRQQQRRPAETVVMVEALAGLLATLHARGRVHRDVKPDNVLYLTSTSDWRLLDLGIVADAGGALALAAALHVSTHGCTIQQDKLAVGWCCDCCCVMN